MDLKTKLEHHQNLPLDIVHQILLCLPVKTLIRFRSVCKSWLSIISHPSFQQDHYRLRQQNPSLLILQRKDGELHFSTCNRNKEGLLLAKKSSFAEPPEYRIFPENLNCYYKIQSCLGLVCMGLPIKGPLLICNPSTEEIIFLPLSPEISFSFGFGYATTSKEFKVVTFFDYFEKKLCNVFTLGTSDWREARNPQFDIRLGSAPFLHGALHLLQYKHKYCEITVFDIESEEYSRIPVPEDYFREGCFESLTEIAGSLYLGGVNTENYPTCHLEIWLLKDYTSGHWVKEYRIDVFLVNPGIGSNDIHFVVPVTILGDGSICLHICSGESKKEWPCYNPKDEIVTQEKGIDDCESAALYIEGFQTLGSGK